MPMPRVISERKKSQGKSTDLIFVLSAIFRSEQGVGANFAEEMGATQTRIAPVALVPNNCKQR